ncbi:hypothetical protein ADIAL_1940 [Alkalibacterium sp. AK22]|nr:hypothetical protein ADIAL_1940 [Alkalibacterium sp. AK22]
MSTQKACKDKPLLKAVTTALQAFELQQISVSEIGVTGF